MSLRICFMVGILAASPGISAAQDVLSGRVVDVQGAVVVDATVTLTESPGGRTRTTRTSDEGTFTFPDVGPGRRALHVTAPGFREWRQDINANAAAGSLVVQLEVAGIVEDVQVAGTAPFTL